MPPRATSAKPKPKSASTKKSNNKPKKNPPSKRVSQQRGGLSKNANTKSQQHNAMQSNAQAYTNSAGAGLHATEQGEQQVCTRLTTISKDELGFISIFSALSIVTLPEQQQQQQQGHQQGMGVQRGGALSDYSLFFPLLKKTMNFDQMIKNEIINKINCFIGNTNKKTSYILSKIFNMFNGYSTIRKHILKNNIVIDVTDIDADIRQRMVDGIKHSNISMISQDNRVLIRNITSNNSKKQSGGSLTIINLSQSASNFGMQVVGDAAYYLIELPCMLIALAFLWLILFLATGNVIISERDSYISSGGMIDVYR
jgi:hypothetical protein